jgi:hypothetical protein
MIADCFTEAERTQLREYIAFGIMPSSPFLLACLNGDEALAASLDQERAKAAMPLLFCFFPPKAHGAPTKVARWNRTGGACGQRTPRQKAKNDERR